MLYIIASLLGMLAGAACTFLALEVKRRNLEERKRELDTRAAQLQHALRTIKENEAESVQAINARQEKVNAFNARLKLDYEAKQRELNRNIELLKAEEARFRARVVSYDELSDENRILKRDLRNLNVHVQKLQLDREQQRQVQDSLDRRTNELGSRYLKDHVKWTRSSLTPNNFASCKQRLQKAVESCHGIGLEITADEEAALFEDLKTEYEKVVRAAVEREEQARIKAQIREEQKLEREIERELKQLDRERQAIQAALEKAVAEARDEHSAEIENLKARLAEAEEKSQRAMSRAQMTRSGHVYVISNIGSFGEGIFKIGLTRRLEPMDRVKELGDASVPFPFDVHMMISSDDAPALENAVHRTLHKLRVNKVNPRKEFFKTDVESIYRIVEEHHGEVEYIADAEALEYRQSLTISDEDQDFIESVYNKLDDDGDQ